MLGGELDPVDEPAVVDEGVDLRPGRSGRFAGQVVASANRYAAAITCGPTRASSPTRISRVGACRRGPASALELRLGCRGACVRWQG